MCETLKDEKNLSKSIIYIFIRSISVQTDIYYRIHSWQLFELNNFMLFHSYQLTADS
jgi:hypothetical protein